jgi:GNAT superfamily N-acetyltransferase
LDGIEVRAATPADIPVTERQCWRGGEAEMARRIATQGTCSFIALDGGRPIAQLYLRTYEPGFRSPGGMHDGAWWADLSGVEGHRDVPPGPIGLLGCWHVGRVREPDGSEQPAPEYRGRGLGIRLLETAVAWAQSPDSPYALLAAKAASREDRDYLGWLGGLPLSIFAERGFVDLGAFDDPHMLAGVNEIPEEVRAGEPWRFHLVGLEVGTTRPGRP